MVCYDWVSTGALGSVITCLCTLLCQHRPCAPAPRFLTAWVFFVEQETRMRLSDVFVSADTVGYTHGKVICTCRREVSEDLVDCSYGHALHGMHLLWGQRRLKHPSMGLLLVRQVRHTLNLRTPLYVVNIYVLTAAP